MKIPLSFPVCFKRNGKIPKGLLDASIGSESAATDAVRTGISKCRDAN